MDKKLFELEKGTPTDSHLIAFGKQGETYKNVTIGDFKKKIIEDIPPAPAPEFLTKIVNIGSFDMRNGASKDVYLGVSLNKIRGISVIITANDLATFPIYYPHSNWELSASWRIESTPTNNAKLHFTTNNNRFFDQSGFSGSNNRGYITVTYVE